MSNPSYDIPTQKFADDGQAITRYRPVSVLAVLSIVFGGLSLLDFLHPALYVVPILGVACGWLALLRMRRAVREMIGEGLAWGGIALSLTLGGIGWIVAGILSSGETPYGYTVLAFEDMQPGVGQIYDPTDPKAWVPSAVRKLDGQKVFIRGFIYPTKKYYNLKQFIMVPTESHCNFCNLKQLKSTEMVEVTMAGDMTTNYTQAKVGVGGRLRLNPEEATNPMGGFPYTLEADCVK